MQSFDTLASLCIWVGLIEPDLVTNSIGKFSRYKAH